MYQLPPKLLNCSMRNTLYIFKAALMLYAKKSESRNINCHKEKGNNKICTKWKCGLFMIFVISNMMTERNRKEEYLHKSWNYCVNSPTVYSSHRRYFFIWTPKELERTRREEAKKERNDRKRGETRHKNYFTSCWKKCFRHSRVVKKKNTVLRTWTCPKEMGDCPYQHSMFIKKAEEGNQKFIEQRKWVIAPTIRKSKMEGRKWGDA